MSALDSFDRKILRELEANANQTNAELAKKVGLSPSPCLRRVKALEKAGVISKWTIEIDRKALGLNFTVFVSVKVASHHDNDWQEFIEKIKRWDEVVSCRSLSGDRDFNLEVVVKDPEAYQEFLFNKLIKDPLITDVHSSFLLKEFKPKTLQIPLR